jgi:signal transduction histidine kinase
MRPPKILQATTFRLAAIYVAGFALAVAAFGIMTYFVTARTLERRLDSAIAMDMKALQADYGTGGLTRLLGAVSVHEHSHPNGPLDYAVILNGSRVAGHLTTWPSVPGWSTLPYRESEGDNATRRFLVANLKEGVTLAIAADPEEVDEVKEAIFYSFLSAFGAVLVLGVVGGIGLSLTLLRRVEMIRRTAEAIIAGDLSRRVPLCGSSDDLDRLSQTLNDMLDRIGELMASLREVSANIAHDLKTPLARLRQRLELARMQPDDMRKVAVELAVAEVDEILGIFAALLRIAQIEAGTRRSGFAEVNLSEIFATVAEAFAPAAEDAGQTLKAAIAPNLKISGDRELLTQMLANLVDNAIRYAGSGASIAIELHRRGKRIVGCVSDNGPGVPSVEHELIFRRFHRSPTSHSVSGSGLGLSLVKAVADIHGIAVHAEDATPGLRIVMRFPSGINGQIAGMSGSAKIAENTKKDAAVRLRRVYY